MVVSATSGPHLFAEALATDAVIVGRLVAAPNGEATGSGQVASHAAVHYIDRAGLPGATGAISPGPYRSFRELSLSGLVGSDTWRPPTFVGNPGSSAPTAGAAPHFAY